MNPQQRRRWKSFWDYQIKIGNDRSMCEAIRENPEHVFDVPNEKRDTLIAQAYEVITKACFKGAQRQAEASRKFWQQLKADPVAFSQFNEARMAKAEAGRQRKKGAIA